MDLFDPQPGRSLCEGSSIFDSPKNDDDHFESLNDKPPRTTTSLALALLFPKASTTTLVVGLARYACFDANTDDNLQVICQNKIDLL